MAYALGIDLGTTYTAAAIHRNGTLETISLGSHAHTIPTVAFARENGEILTGEAALARGLNDPGRFAKEFKRRLGSSTEIVLGGVTFQAEALLGRVLASVLDTVTSYCGEPPAQIVVTHPASWADHRLQRLETAIRSAGIEEAALAAEPVAAAVFYASQERIPDDARIAVYDLGGGTFDASVVHKSGGTFELVAQPEGDDGIGGIDFDRAVLEHVAASLGDTWTTLDLTDGTVASGVEQLRRHATAAKELLSDDLEVTVPVALPGINRDVRLTRGEFEQRIRGDVESTLATMRRALANADTEPADVHAVLLVGGSSRVPLVGEVVGNGLGRPLAIDAHPKLAICQGAALIAAHHAGLLAPTAEPHTEPAPEPETGAETPDAVDPAPIEEAEIGATPRLTTRNVLIGAGGIAALAIAGFLALNVFGDDDPTVAGPTGTTESPPSTETTGSPATTESPRDTALELPPGEPVTIELWNPTPGVSDPLAEMISAFETQNPDIDVDLVNTTDGYTRLLHDVVDATPDDRPEIALVAGRGMQRMLDLDLAVPAQEMIDRDDFDQEAMLPILAEQFSTDSGLAAVPFNTSTPMVFLNLDVLEDAGIDLDGLEDWTTESLLDACHDVDGLVNSCFTYENPVFLFEQLLANSGGLWLDPDNGRLDRATAAAFDGTLGRAAFDFFVGPVLDGTADGGAGADGNFGAFLAGDSAMLVTSSTRLGRVLSDVAELDEPFRVGIANLPHLTDTTRNGMPGGGAALWLIDSGDDRTNIASWLLIDFLASPEQQAALHRATGSVPITTEAAELLAPFWAENPMFEIPVRQLAGSVPIDAAGNLNLPAIGPLSGWYSEMGQAVKQAFAFAQDETDGVSPEQALADAVERVDSEIAVYNTSVDQ